MNEFEGFAIPSHESERIEDIASQIPGLFFSRREFVNEAISYYISIWGNPEKAYAKFLSFLPFMKQKTLKRVKGLMNPNDFDKMLQESQIKYKKLENSPEKFKKLPTNERHFLDDITIETIEELIKKPKIKNYLQNVDNFFDQAINLFLIIWVYPEKIEEKFFEMFEYIPDSSKSYWKKEQEKSYELFIKKYKKWKTKTQKEDIIQDENSDIIEDKFLKLLNSMKEIRLQKKILEKNSRKPVYALPKENTALVSQFITRFFPIKLSLAVLAKSIIENDGEPISYSEFSDQVYQIASKLSFKLKKMENRKDSKVLRNQKISTGLPEPMSINDENNQNMESSKKRFLQHYIGTKKSTWIKRQKKNRDGTLSIFDGALNSFELAYFVTEPKPDKSNKFSDKIEDIEIKIGITKKGLQFLMLENEILDKWNSEWYPSNWPRPISKDESKFIQDKIIIDFSLEKRLVESAMQTIKEKKGASPSDIDDDFKEPILEWIEGNRGTREEETISKWLVDNNWFGNRDCNAILPWRTSLMGRLSEQKIVDWKITKQEKNENGVIIVKGGISQYTIAE